MGLFRKKVNGYLIKPGVNRHGERWRAVSSQKYKFGALVALSIVGLVGCGMPPSPGSLAIDRAGEVVEAVLAEPNDAQIAVYKRELTANYKAIGFAVLSNGATWADIMPPALKTCRQLANGTSVTDMRAKFIDDLESQMTNYDPEISVLIADASLAALLAPGSLCP